jgi:hypothetical protein
LTCQTLKTRKLAMLIQLASIPNDGGKSYAWSEAKRAQEQTPELFAGIADELKAAMLALSRGNAQALDSATARG